MLQEAGVAGMPLQRPTACRPGGRRIHPAKAAGMESAETKKAQQHTCEHQGGCRSPFKWHVASVADSRQQRYAHTEG